MVPDGGVDVGTALQDARVSGVECLGRVAVGDGIDMAAHGVQSSRAVAVQHGLQWPLVRLRQHQRCCVLLHCLGVLPALELRIASLPTTPRSAVSTSLSFCFFSFRDFQETTNSLKKKQRCRHE